MLQVINAFPPYFFISSFLLPNLQKKSIQRIQRIPNSVFDFSRFNSFVCLLCIWNKDFK